MMLPLSKPVIMFHLSILLATVFVSREGCAEVDDKNSAQAEDKTDNWIAKLAKLNSATYYISVDDLDKFQPGRPKNEILKDLRWRAGFVVASKCDGRSITAINYSLYADSPESHRSESLYALFVDEKFEKLIRSFDWNGPNRTKAGDDCGWLNRAMKVDAVNVDELSKEVKSIKAPPEHIDLGLTAMYLAMRTVGLAPGPPPPEKDYQQLRKNAELRDQFNAARLNIGMTEAEVQATAQGEAA